MFLHIHRHIRVYTHSLCNHIHTHSTLTADSMLAHLHKSCMSSVGDLSYTVHCACLPVCVSVCLCVSVSLCLCVGKFHCPVLFKVFNENSHIVAVRPTGNVFSFEVSLQLYIHVWELIRPSTYVYLGTDCNSCIYCMTAWSICTYVHMYVCWSIHLPPHSVCV